MAAGEEFEEDEAGQPEEYEGDDEGLDDDNGIGNGFGNRKRDPFWNPDRYLTTRRRPIRFRRRWKVCVVDKYVCR